MSQIIQSPNFQAERISEENISIGILEDDAEQLLANNDVYQNVEQLTFLEMVELYQRPIVKLTKQTQQEFKNGEIFKFYKSRENEDSESELDAFNPIFQKV